MNPADLLNAEILIVDDKEDNIRLLEGLLRIAGYTSVTSTTSPHDVRELYRANRYSLILLDLQMPGLDGFQVMEQLRAIEGDGYLPVIVLTAQPAHKLRALEAGARDFISKPFDLAELRARVRNALEVRLLHLETRRYSKQLEETARDLEASREVIRLKTMEEFALAQATQESLLPRCLPQFDNFHIRAFNRPTRYVGGDFYDFVQLAPDRWVGVLADVSGKGISAALLSSMILGALNMEFRAGTPAEEILHRMNRLLCEKSLPFQFVTLFLFILNPDGVGQFINAGHEPAYVFRAATGKVERLVSESYFVGMFDFATYASRAFQLDKGDILAIYSDGLTDAEGTENEDFGKARLRDILREHAPFGSHAVETALLKAVDHFTQGLPQTDDLTFLLIEKLR